MKKIIKLIRRWRYRRLYRRLFWLYADKNHSAEYSCCEAAIAFSWITGCEWRDVF